MKEFFEKLISYFTDQGVSVGLAVAYIVVSALLVIMVIAALIMRIMVFVRYMKTNHVKTSNGKTSCEVARMALDQNGLNYVQVKKASFIRAWFFGNSYSLSKKTIFLRRTIMDRDSLTAVGLALQKVGVAKMIANGEKKAIIRNLAQILGLFGPFLFIPLVLTGFILDILLFKTLGVFSIVFIIVGLVLLSAGFVVTILNIPVEKKANDMALEMIDNNGICTEEERKQIKTVLDTYIIAYVLEFIVLVLRIAQLVLEILMNSQIKSNNS